MSQRLIDDGFAAIVDFDHPRLDDDADLVFESMSHDSSPRAGQQVIRVVGTDDEVEAMARLAPADSTVEQLSFAELEQTDADGEAVTVVWIAEPSDPRVTEWNRAAYRLRRRWSPVSGFDGQVAMVGPYVYPPQTPCYECHRRTRASHSTLEEDYLDYQSVAPFRLTGTAQTHLLPSIALLQLRLVARCGSPHVPGAVQAVTMHEGVRMDTEYVLRVPRCTACRPAAVVTRRAVWSRYFDVEPE